MAGVRDMVFAGDGKGINTPGRRESALMLQRSLTWTKMDVVTWSRKCRV